MNRIKTETGHFGRIALFQEILETRAKLRYVLRKTSKPYVLFRETRVDDMKIYKQTSIMNAETVTTATHEDDK